MVAIFTGAGTGFERGSGSVLGGAGLLGSGALGRSGAQAMLNAATGNLMITQRDEFLVGQGPDAVINRTYNSRGDYTDDNGDNWRQSTQRQVRGLTGTVNTAGSTVERVSGDGSVITYRWTAAASAYVATDGAGAHDRLTHDGTWRWRDGDSQTVETYGGPDGQISAMTDISGNTVNYYYDAQKRLIDITTANGETIQYQWNAQGNLSEIRTFYTEVVDGQPVAKALTRTRYTYDASNRLETVTVDLSPQDGSVADGKSYTTRYGYDGTSKRVSAITETDGSRLDITYDGAERVISLKQTVIAGTTRETTIAYEANATIITDQQKNNTRLDYAAGTNQLLKITTPAPILGGDPQIVRFAYDAEGNLTDVTDPQNATTHYDYDGNGNLITSTDPLGQVVQRSYNAANQLTVETRTGSDATGTANAHSTRYAYDEAGRLRFVVDGENGVTEYRVGQFGRVDVVRQFANDAFNTAGWDAPMALDFATMVAWAANKTGSPIVENAYDGRLNLVARVSYGRTNVNGTPSTGDGYTHEFFTYDQAGQLLSRSKAGMNAETFVYDGLGRLTASTDSAHIKTKIQFNDAATNTTVTLASGLVRTSTTNLAGDLISVTETGDNTAGGLTSYVYDTLGRVRITNVAIDEARTNNIQTYHIYDALGRKVADVDDSHAMTEYRYDANDRLVATVRYATLLSDTKFNIVADLDASPDISWLRPDGYPDIAEDIWSWTVYDKAGRVIETIQGDGAATVFEYDASDRLVRTKVYKEKIADLTAFKTAAPTTLQRPAASAEDSVARIFYDRAGRVIGTLDGEGHLSRTRYDLIGRPVETTAFATATAADGTFAQLVASAGSSASDAITRSVYDGQGFLRFTIDGLNRVTAYGYQEVGNAAYTAFGPVREITRFAGIIPSLSSYTMDSVRTALANAGLTGRADNRIERSVYDLTGRLVYSIAADGAVVGYHYDEGGRVDRTIAYEDRPQLTQLPVAAEMDYFHAAAMANPANRITRSYYNERGELRYTIDAVGVVTRNDYDSQGKLSYSATYDTKVAVTDPSTIATVAASISVNGKKAETRFEYDQNGRLKRTTDPTNHVREFAYDAAGTLRMEIASPKTSQTTPGTNQESRTYYQYDATGRMKSRTDGYGTAVAAETQYAYDGRGNLVSVTDPDNNITTSDYDKADQLVKVTNALNGSRTFGYDALGNQIRETDERDVSTHRYYDRVGRVIAVRDGEDHVTETTYTQFGEVETVTRRFNRATNSDVKQLPAVTADARDATTGFEYDKLGRVITILDAERDIADKRYVERKEYDAFGNVKKITNKIDGVTDYYYDRRGMLEDEVVQVAAYNADGAQTSLSIRTHFEYDSRGNLKARTEAYGSASQRVTTYSYDLADRLKSTVGETVSVLAANFVGTTSVAPTDAYDYDTRGNLIRSLDANNQATLFYYDALDREIARVDPAGALTESEYDKAGNLVTTRAWSTAVSPTKNADGTPLASAPGRPGGAFRQTTIEYDKLNRPITTTVREGTGTADNVTGVWTGKWNGEAYQVSLAPITTRFEYDAAGNVHKTTDANGGQVFSYYDRSGRKAAQIDQGGYLTTWGLDAEGNVLTETRYAKALTGYSTGDYPEPTRSADDRTTTFTYDRAGHRTSETRERVVAYTVNGSGGLDLDARTDSTITYRYNGLGEVSKRIEANGDTTTYAYDKAGRLETEVRASYLSDANATVSPRLTYRYDALGNLVRTEQGAVEEVAGDPVRVTRSIYGAGGRLARTINAADEATDYGYDAAGNVVTQTYKRRAADGTSTDEGLLITRDQLGRVASQTLGTYASGTWAKGDVQQFEYNLHGEVARRGVNGGWQEEFAYDAGGRLWRSNAGDGVWRYFVSDANGNRTATIESEGNAIAGLTIDQAMWMAGNGSFAVGRDYIDGLNVTVSVHDARGQQTDSLMRHRETSVGALTSLWTQRAYNAFGEVASETDATPNRNMTRYAYNTMGRLMTTTRPKVDVRGEDGVLTQAFAPVEWSFSDLAGRTVGVEDANGRRTARLLLAGTGHMSGGGGSEALVVKEWHADQNSVLNGYDRFGDRVGATDELGRKTKMTYDAMGRLTGVTRPSKQWEAYAYDQLGQRIRHYTSAIAEAQGETTSYDRQGRVTATRGFGGAGVGEVTKTSYEWQASLSNAGLGTSGGWKQLTTAANDRVSSEISDAFGHVTYAGDLGGHVTTFTYDLAGRLAKSETVGGETVATRWLNTGLAGVVTSDLGTVAAPERGRAVYGYDAAGRKVSESYVLDGVQRQNATARYDALGRMVEWKELGNAVVPASYLLTDYDKVGNVVHTKASHVGLDAQGNWTAAREDEVWTRHDVMNRVTTAGGSLVNNAIVRGATGQDLTYDAAGERATSTRTVKRTKVVANPNYNPGTGNSDVYIDDTLVDNRRTLTIDYDAVQREEFAYDGDGRLVDVRVAESGATDDGNGGVTVAPPPAQGTRRASYTYTTMGRLEYQADYGSNGTTVVYDRRLDYDVRGRVGTETSNVARGAETVRTVSTTGYGTGTGSALGAPVTVSTKTFVNDGYRSTATTTHDYAWYAGAVQAKTTHRPDTAQSQLFTTDYGYDTAGRLTGVHIADGRPRDVAFVNDLAGQALARDEADNLATGDPHQRWYRFDGREMGSISNDGTDETSYAVSIDRRLAAAAPDATGPFRDGGAASVANADYDGQVRSITSFSSAGAAGGIHTVREGDTLAGLAASLWGDASLWYKLASANGLSAASALVPGQTLTIPAGVTRSGRTASTFKPFDAAEVQGDLSPTSPKPQAAAAKHNKCGAMGAILLTVVAVAVVAIVAGPAGAAVSNFLAGPAAAANAAAASAGVLAAGGSAAAATAASAAVLGTTAVAGGAIAGGVLAGAAGSIISQGVGVATGLQDKFSWKGVALAGISGGVGGGLGVALPGSGIGTAIARGALGNAVTQGIGVATRLQSKFDFAGVAVAGVVHGIGAWASASLPGHALYNDAGQLTRSATIGNQAMSGAASAVAGAAARSLLTGTGFGDNVMAVLPDVIGSTIGQMIAVGVQRATAAPARAQARAGGNVYASLSGGLPGLLMGAPMMSDVTADAPPEAWGPGITITAQRWWEKAWSTVSKTVTDLWNSPIVQDSRDWISTRVANTLTFAQNTVDRVNSAPAIAATRSSARAILSEANGFRNRMGWNADGLNASVGRIPADLSNLGGALRRGDFQYGLDGLPPTLGGGTGSTLAGLGTAIGGLPRIASRMLPAATVSAPAPAVAATYTAAEKGVLAETQAASTMARAGYTELVARLPRNQGFDGVFVRHGPSGAINDIIITESKYSSTGYASLAQSSKGQQLSERWIDATLRDMSRSTDPSLRATYKVLYDNPTLIRTKANVLTPDGINRWNRINLPVQ